jgi:hypothetical protein
MTHLSYSLVEELYKHLWDREKREESYRHQLIYSVTFEHRHYLDLQTQLSKPMQDRGLTTPGPGRINKFYNAVEVSRWKQAYEPKKNNETYAQWECGAAPPTDDPYEYPFRAMVLDIRSLHLRHWPLEESVILLRRSYFSICKLLAYSGALYGARGSVLIDGQPGIGKFAFCSLTSIGPF